MELPNVPGESHRFDEIEAALRPATRTTVIGECQARIVPVQEVLDQATTLISRDPGALLCEERSCRCASARRQREAAAAAELRPG